MRSEMVLSKQHITAMVHEIFSNMHAGSHTTYIRKILNTATVTLLTMMLSQLLYLKIEPLPSRIFQQRARVHWYEQVTLCSRC